MKYRKQRKCRVTKVWKIHQTLWHQNDFYADLSNFSPTKLLSFMILFSLLDNMLVP